MTRFGERPALRASAGTASAIVAAVVLAATAAARPAIVPCCGVTLSDSRLAGLTVTVAKPAGYSGSSPSWAGPAWTAGSVSGHASLEWRASVVPRRAPAAAAKAALLHGWPTKASGTLLVPAGNGKTDKAFYVVTQAPPGILGGQTEAAIAVNPFAPCCNVVVRISLPKPYGDSARVGQDKTPAAAWNLRTALALVKSVRFSHP